MSSAREIITISAGNFANFVGSHWWNIQETSFCYEFDCTSALDIDHDVLFQEGLNHRRQLTFTPRLLLIDLESNMCGLRKECSLYRQTGNEKPDAFWDGSVEVVRQTQDEMNPYLENADLNQKAESGEEVFYNRPVHPPTLESPPSAWSQFLKTNLHPRSLVLFNDIVSPTEENPVNLYSYGKEIYSAIEEQSEDVLRQLAENCDYLQGFQLLCEGTGAFSSIGNHLLQHLTDEYKGKDSFCFPLYQQCEFEPVQRQYSTLYSLSGLKSFSSVFSPISLAESIFQTPSRTFPQLQYEPLEAYQSSAILATGLEVLSSPYRLRKNRQNLMDLASLLTPHGRKMLCSCLCLSPESRGSADQPFVPLTPNYDLALKGTSETMIQMAALRGIHNTLSFNQSQDETAEEHFMSFLQSHVPCPYTTSNFSAEPIRIAPPYPPIFRNTVDKLAAVGVFSNSDCAYAFLSEATCDTDGRRLRDYAKLREAGFNLDEFLEVVEEVNSLKDAYDSCSYLSND